jgi:hypothetical protein
MHLVCFWPSPTSRARRERQRGESGVRWRVGTARFFVQERCFSRVCKMTPFCSPHLAHTAPRLRTGESMHLVCFWPSPTSRARRERQRVESGVRWRVGTARFCVQEGCFSRVCKMTPFSPHLAHTAPRLRTGESMHLVCFWPSPTSRARRERQRVESGVRWRVGTARFCVQEGCFFPVCVK